MPHGYTPSGTDSGVDPQGSWQGCQGGAGREGFLEEVDLEAWTGFE